MKHLILLEILASLFSGAFITNFLPHFVHGVSGKPFTTPFAKPRGIGSSSPTLNVIWGVINLLAGLALAAAGNLCAGNKIFWISFFAGLILMALFLSKRLAKQHQYKKDEQVQ